MKINTNNNDKNNKKKNNNKNNSNNSIKANTTLLFVPTSTRILLVLEFYFISVSLFLSPPLLIFSSYDHALFHPKASLTMR